MKLLTEIKKSDKNKKFKLHLKMFLQDLENKGNFILLILYGNFFSNITKFHSYRKFYNFL